MMSTELRKRHVRDLAIHLLDRANKKQINHSCISNLVKVECKEQARLTGAPEYWRDYWPTDLLGESAVCTAKP